MPIGTAKDDDPVCIRPFDTVTFSLDDLQPRTDLPADKVDAVSQARDMTLTLDTSMRRNPAMIFTDLDDIVVMMDPDEGKYYEFDAIGARIWTLLEHPRPVVEMCEVLVGEYDVTPDLCHRDVLSFLEEAHALGIVEVCTSAAP